MNFFVTHKKFVTQFIAFSICLCVILFSLQYVLSFGIKHSQMGQYNKMNNIMINPNKPDIAIFGSSVGENGINPNLLSSKTKMSAYNYSIEGTSLVQYEGLVKEFIEKNNQTKVVVIADLYELLKKRTALTRIQYYTSFINNENVYKSLHNLQPDLAFNCRYVPFYKFVVADHYYYKSAIQGISSFIKKQTLKDTLNGQNPIKLNFEDADLKKVQAMKPFAVDINHLNIEILNEIFLLAQQKNQKVVLLITPAYKDILKLVTNINAVRDTLQSITNKYKNVYYLDYTNCSLTDKREFFFNSTHLNNKGADYFTNLLSDTISSISKQTLIK